MSLPRFPGWRALELTDTTRAGDVFVRVNGDVNDTRVPHPENAIWGNALNRSPAIWAGGTWWVYRKENEKSTIPRRLIGHKMFSVPLPLP